ncbi:hypothetical protein FR483_n252R [Paramecium bursaria Chlorella virus FR483]|uniref:Uncharacterized protein n252R n=1 Tax=Paramecium bursaria Chlorella virus FR483 TaxID=399781 RepID=A7J6V6_PBCVF|nr:hypothetical protein FR483_n252R [Paramecium bursaria Chlorella virus FR483]ABT15537.1 hypothetical protein FR483_n252R [Paramecium bursaria Chlorella virus FR483]
MEYAGQRRPITTECRCGDAGDTQIIRNRVEHTGQIGTITNESRRGYRIAHSNVCSCHISYDVYVSN